MQCKHKKIVIWYQNTRTKKHVKNVYDTLFLIKVICELISICLWYYARLVYLLLKVDK
jgi:hypothetical protein